LKDPDAFARSGCGPACTPRRVGRLRKAAFGGPAQVPQVPVARYTHRVAISNSRIVQRLRRQGDVPFQRLAGRRHSKTMTLSGVRRRVPAFASSCTFAARFVQDSPTGGGPGLLGDSAPRGKGKDDVCGRLCSPWTAIVRPPNPAKAAKTDGTAIDPARTAPAVPVRRCGSFARVVPRRPSGPRRLRVLVAQRVTDR